MREHRVPMLGTALRRRVDPVRSPDPHVRQLVGALAGLEVAPAPRPEFRAELRAQLVAVAPRLVDEGDPTLAAHPTPASAEPSPATATDAPRKTGFRFARPLIAAACVLSAFVLLLGGAVLLSRNALPGDALYSLKRASEDTQYGLTGGTVAKGKLKLEFAGRRIGEVTALLPRNSALAAGSGPMADSGQLNADTSKLVRETLGSANGDVQSAARMLGGAAVRGKTASPLRAMTTWAPGQIAAMNKIVARIPAGSLHQQALATRNMIVAAQTRAAALIGDLGCSCLSTSSTDNLGPHPVRDRLHAHHAGHADAGRLDRTGRCTRFDDQPFTGPRDPVDRRVGHAGPGRNHHAARWRHRRRLDRGHLAAPVSQELAALDAAADVARAALAARALVQHPAAAPAASDALAAPVLQRQPADQRHEQLRQDPRRVDLQLSPSTRR